MSGDIEKWADAAMFKAEEMPEEALKAPQVHLIQMTADPLGAAAAMNAMYVGKVARSLADVTHEERKALLVDMQKTVLKLPMEAIKFHFLIEGVTRAFTHQLVRTRMAGFAQESMRFAVFGVGRDVPVALPPSLAGTKGNEPLGAEDSKEEYTRNLWDQAVEMIGETYVHMVDAGMPAEDARGILPTNILTRIHMIIDLRALVAMSGQRLCTQAQFEWRYVFAQIAKAIRGYNPNARLQAQLGRMYGEGDPSGTESIMRRIDQAYLEDQWQYEAIADLFRPICYQTGKCEFKASADRKCSIRSRVEANHIIARESDLWSRSWVDSKKEVEETHEGVGWGASDDPVKINAIHPQEWLLNPGAAR